MPWSCHSLALIDAMSSFRFIQECAVRGVLVMLDMHRLAAAKDIPELWYDQDYPEAKVLEAWKTIVLR